MECGAQDLLCNVLTWVSESELAASRATELAARLGENATGAWSLLAAFLKHYGQTIVAAAGLSFGFYRWWLYRERILHKRLSEYIGSREARLIGARAQVLEAIQRPAPGMSAEAPLFIDGELSSVLREREWDNTALALTVASSAEWQLSRAIDSITRKLQTAEREVSCLRQELCTAFSVRGAVAATKPRPDHALLALGHFRSALGLSGEDTDAHIKELEAHQLRKLGYYSQAQDAYERVIELAGSIQPARAGVIMKARAKRYLAEMERSGAPRKAYLILTSGLVGGQHSPGAIALLESCQPLGAWELVEKADMHYFAAFLAHVLTFPNAEQAHLQRAGAAYDNALLSSRRARWRLRRSTSRLRKRIIDGRKRVAIAQSTGKYDTDWLPELQQPQQPSPEISTAGGHEAIAETA